MNVADLQHNKPVLLGVAAAGVAGLALWQRRRAAAVPATSAGARTAIPGTLPAAAVVSAGSTGVGGYDSSSYDLYNALQPEIDAILAQQQAATNGGGITTAPTPVASALLNNTDWENAAVQEWAHTGGAPLDLQAALSQYLSGQPINTAQASGVNWTIGKYGLAPGGTSGMSPIVKA